MSDPGATFNPFGGDLPGAMSRPTSTTFSRPTASAAMAAAALRPMGTASVVVSNTKMPVDSGAAGAARHGSVNPFGDDGAASPALSGSGVSVRRLAVSNEHAPASPTVTGFAASIAGASSASVSSGSASGSLAAFVSAPPPLSLREQHPLLHGPSLEVDCYIGDACPVHLPKLLPDGRLGATVPASLTGEAHILKDLDCYFRSPLGHRIMGTISATTYQVVFSTLPAGVAPGATGGAGSAAAAAAAAAAVPAGGLLQGSLRHLHPSFFVAPVTAIRRIEKSTPRGKEAGSFFTLDIAFKDVRAWSLVFREEALADRVLHHLKIVAFPARPDYLFAFEEAKALAAEARHASHAGGTPTPAAAAAAAGAAAAGAGPSAAPGAAGSGALPGWDVYNPYRELSRLGVLEARHPRTGLPLWRVSDVNREYRYCPTYPAVLVFPERLSDGALPAIGTFRSKARVPALTWMHPVNKTTLWRCSQPRVGMGNNACREDETLFALIREANVFVRDPSAPLLIADCRPKANAMANKAGGWGYENYAFGQLEFLGIHNIHAVRESFRKMEALALAPAASDVAWASAVADAGWLHHVRAVLSAGLFVAESMHRRGQSVVVHCSDGWDRTAQVCGLVQVLLDPHARTLRGLCSLVAKEWASFGHKFHERCGHGNEKADADGDFSPIFLQWLDALAQLVRMFPRAFQFNERALLLLAHHAYSCRFGTFLFNCERERAEARLHQRTQSLWEYMLNGPPERMTAITNAGYDPAAGDVLLPHPCAVLRGVEVWAAWFLRWAAMPSMLPDLLSPRLERYPDTAVDRAALAATAAASAALAGGAAAHGGAGAAAAAGGSAHRPAGGAAAARPHAPSESEVRDPLTGAILSAPAPAPAAAAAASVAAAPAAALQASPPAAAHSASAAAEPDAPAAASDAADFAAAAAAADGGSGSGSFADDTAGAAARPHRSSTNSSSGSGSGAGAGGAGGGAGGPSARAVAAAGFTLGEGDEVDEADEAAAEAELGFASGTGYPSSSGDAGSRPDSRATVSPTPSPSPSSPAAVAAANAQDAVPADDDE